VYFIRKVLIVAVIAVIGVLLLGESRAGLAAGITDGASSNILINLPSLTLELYSGSALVKAYSIAIGKPSTPTPIGEFFIVDKEVNPSWYPPGTKKVVLSGPDNPLGYRWLGFYSTYGIHGTNVPESIGLMVSNGCIRMHEEDVEELFNKVSCGTKVAITYDRVKVAVSTNGQVSLRIYPDVYGYYNVTLADVKNCLSSFGANGWVSDGALSQLLAEASGRPIGIVELQTINVNGRKLADYAVGYDNNLYVPVWPVAVALGVDIVWEKESMLVRNKTGVVPGVVKADRIYISVADVAKLFNCQTTREQAKSGLYIETMPILSGCRSQLFDGSGPEKRFAKMSFGLNSYIASEVISILPIGNYL